MLVTGRPQPGREGLAAQGARDQLKGPQAGGRLLLPVAGPVGVPEGRDQAGCREGGLLLQGGEGEREGKREQGLREKGEICNDDNQVEEVEIT